MPEQGEPGEGRGDRADEQPETAVGENQPELVQGAIDEDQAAAQQVAPMRQVEFTGVVLELPSTHPTIVFQEVEEPRRELRVTIGQTEGVSIAYAWRGVATPRPLTHDLFVTVLEQLSVQVDVVRITGAEGPVFHAELALSGPTGSRTVQCRPSDALALALRQRLPVPIMVAEEVLAAVGGGL